MIASPRSIAEQQPMKRKRVRILRLVFLLFLIAGGWKCWLVHDFNKAQQEAEKLRWLWTYDDPFEAVKKDWKAAFKMATWRDGDRNLLISGEDLNRNPGLVLRLAPLSLYVVEAPALQNLVALKRLSTLKVLCLEGCKELKDVGALVELPGLEVLSISGCAKLADLAALEKLTSLKTLKLADCESLKNFDAIKALPGLQTIRITLCFALADLHFLKECRELKSVEIGECAKLTSADGLAGLSALETLTFWDCHGLTNLDALKETTGLKVLTVRGCPVLKRETVREVMEALPGLKVTSDRLRL